MLVHGPEAVHAADVEWGRRGLMGFVEVMNSRYKTGWVHRRICAKLEAFSAAVAREESPRLIITMPPRTGKTEIVSQRWPVWHMAKHADHEVIMASCTQKLANKSSRKARDVVARSELAGEIFGGKLGPKLKPSERPRGAIPLADGIEEWTIQNGSSYQSVGVKGNINGSGAHVLIIDDYLKDRKKAEVAAEREDIYEWYISTAIQRVAPGGGVIIMATRWHSEDLIGMLLEDAENGGEEFEVLHLPALATEDEPIDDDDAEVAALCEDLAEDEAGRPLWRRKGDALHPARFDRKALLARKGAITRRHGLRDWSAQYQGAPISAEGDFLKRIWYRTRYSCQPDDIASTAEQVWISVDAAQKDEAKSDFHACHLWALRKSKRYLLDRVSDQVQYPEFESMLDGFIARHRHWVSSKGGVLVENTANGLVYLQTRGVSYNGCTLVPFQPKDSKEFRAKFLQRISEAGGVVLPDSGTCPWAEVVLAEWCAFPGGGHDDDVDAASQLMMRWTLEEQAPRSLIRSMAGRFRR